MALNAQEKLICQAIIKEVEGHEVSTDEIVAFRSEFLGQDDQGNDIRTVIVITKYALYSFGRSYFKQLIKKFKSELAKATIQQMTTPSTERIYQCPHCVDGCSYCGYGSLVASGHYPGKPDTDEYQFLLHSPNTYSVYIGGNDTCYGLIQKIRNPECFWDNDPMTYYWIAGDGVHYTGAIHAADALLAWTNLNMEAA